MSTTTPKTMKAVAAVTEGVRKGDLYSVEPELLLEEPGFNLRDYTKPDVVEQINQLEKMFIDGQYLPPLLVRVGEEGRIYIVDGHLRRLAMLQAKKNGHTVGSAKCIAFNGNDAERIQVMLRSADGLKFKPLEVAQGYLRLSRLGYSNTEIAKAAGRTPNRVEQLLTLATANRDVQILVANEQVAADAAIEAVRRHGDGAGAFLSEQLNRSPKVTKGAVTGPSIPRAVASHVTTTFDSMFKRGSAVTRQLAEWERSGKTEGVQISIDAAVLQELKDAHDTLLARQAKRDERELQKAEKAAQLTLDDEQE